MIYNHHTSVASFLTRRHQPDSVVVFTGKRNISQTIKDNRSVGIALINQAMCYGLNGEIEKAISLAEQSLRALEQIDDLFQNIVRANQEKWKKEFQITQFHKKGRNFEPTNSKTKTFSIF